MRPSIFVKKDERRAEHPRGEKRAKRGELLDGRRHANEPTALAFVVEIHDAVDFREEGVIAADADVRARIELRSALAHEDRSAGDELSRKTLATQHFRL